MQRLGFGREGRQTEVACLHVLGHRTGERGRGGAVGVGQSFEVSQFPQKGPDAFQEGGSGKWESRRGLQVRQFLAELGKDGLANRPFRRGLGWQHSGLEEEEVGTQFCRKSVW